MSVFRAGWRTEGYPEDIKPYLFSSYPLARAFLVTELQWGFVRDTEGGSLILKSLADSHRAPWSGRVGKTTYFIEEVTLDTLKAEQ